MTWVYGNPWQDQGPRYLRTPSGQMTKLPEKVESGEHQEGSSPGWNGQPGLGETSPSSHPIALRGQGVARRPAQEVQGAPRRPARIKVNPAYI